MSDWKLPWEASCRCGGVRMRITAPPLMSMACHCRGCQRMTASAFSLSLLLPAAGFEVTSGELAIGGLHGASRHHHCAHCKSWLFTHPEGLDEMVNFRATMLEAGAWFVPWVETCTDEAFDWATTGAKHRFPDIPAPEAFGPLIAEYAARAPRPG